MAWGAVNVKDEKSKFINSYLSRKHTISDLCKHYRISRPTAYKWIERYNHYGIEGLEELSRVPHSSPNETHRSLVQKIVKVRDEYGWGADKILAYLQKYEPKENWPSVTTVHNILEREGLVVPRRLRKRVSPQTRPLTETNQCNEVWCTDFKGDFITGDGIKCAPLTLTDNYSRFLIQCTVLPANNTEYVWQYFDKAFREYGKPIYMRSDNGAPFGSTGVGRLCRLAIKLIKAGVIPEWISPGKPQENGRHERMHRTLKSEVASPPAATLRLQKKRLLDFQDYYNSIRPHEALGQRTPSECYVKSNREWNGIFNSPEYECDYKVCKVGTCGKIWFRGRKDPAYIGRVLKNEPVGLLEIDDDEWEVHYGPIFLGIINRKNVLQRPKRSSRAPRRAT